MNLLHVQLLGFTAATARRLLLSVVVLLGIVAIRYLFVWTVQLATGQRKNERTVFWTRQAASLITAILIVIALVSIWFKDAGHLATIAGLVGAGLAFALQKAVTAFAGYLIILRGKTFTVGDRISMGGVRGDVISLGFLQTRIMEMGEPDSVQSADDSTWVHARQYTGRIVTVTNDKVFDTPVYNYTREFPFIWEEVKIPIAYGSDRRRAEAIIVECAREETERFEEMSEPQRRALEREYFVDFEGLKPRVYYALTDNWIELTLRFLVRERGIRQVKDRLARSILERFEREKIGIASGTYAVVEFPPVTIEGTIVDRIARALEAQAPADRRRSA